MSTVPDLLRLLAIPVLGWAAYRDVLTRRIPNDVWAPLALLGAVALVWDGLAVWGTPYRTLWALRVALSLFIVIPLAYGFWWIGGFGGADAKAFMVIAILFPTYPTYQLGGHLFPLVETSVGVFSLTILTNTVLVGLAYPLLLGVRNLLAGERAWVVFLGRVVAVERIPRLHGSLLETPDGFTRNGLDLDAVRMYLRWRGVDLADLRADRSLRDPATLPAEPGDPTDGAVATDGGVDDPGDHGDRGHHPDRLDAGYAHDDPWGAQAFLDDIDTDAYGTTPETLRAGLDVLVSREEVWITPGIPFVVPTVVGLLLALTVGDLLFLVLRAVGLA